MPSAHVMERQHRNRSVEVFIGDSGGPEYVIVRGARFPAKDPALPDNAREIAANCAKLSKIGYFAAVGIVSSEQP